MTKRLALFLLALVLLGLVACGPDTYTVVFDANGGEPVSGQLVQTIEEGQSATPPELVREGYTYEWDSEAWKNVQSNVAIQAIWTENQDSSEEAMAATVEAAEPGTYYSPMDSTGACYYSLVETYQRVTGATCILSDNGYENQYEGYIDLCYYYEYAYDQTQKQVYVDYLLSQGYSLDHKFAFDEGTSEYYWNAEESICFDLFVPTDGKLLYIYPKYDYME